MAEDRRGEDGPEEAGDKAGDDGRGELMSPKVRAGMVDLNAPLALGPEASSTSLSRDCKKLGPEESDWVLFALDSAGLDVSPRSSSSARASGRLVRGRLSLRSG